MKKLTRTTLLLILLLPFAGCQEEVVPQLENSKTETSEVLNSPESETDEEEENEGSDIRK